MLVLSCVFFVWVGLVVAYHVFLLNLDSLLLSACLVPIVSPLSQSGILAVSAWSSVVLFCGHRGSPVSLPLRFSF